MKVDTLRRHFAETVYAMLVVLGLKRIELPMRILANAQETEVLWTQCEDKIVIELRPPPVICPTCNGSGQVDPKGEGEPA